MVRMDDAEGPALAASLLRLPLLRLGQPALDGRLSVALTVRVDEEKPETSSVRARVSNELVVRNLPAGYDIGSIRQQFSWDVYDAYGGSIRHKSGAQSPEWIAASETPPHLAAAIIMGIDPQFGEHKGISDLALSTALTDRLKNRRRGGGYATISQRVAEILWPRNGPAIRCSIERALLATHLESALSKDDLLEIFLNSAPWGQGRHGLKEAARYLFGKSPGELAPEESALIAIAMASPKRIVVDETGAACPDARTDAMDLLNALYRGGLLGDQGLRTAEAAVNRTWWPVTVTRPANASDAGPVVPEATR